MINIQSFENYPSFQPAPEGELTRIFKDYHLIYKKTTQKSRQNLNMND
jgi:hypothetical protein